MRLHPVLAAVAAVAVIAGCGSSGGTPARQPDGAVRGRATTVNPADVPRVLAAHGLKVAWRQGPIPAGDQTALYGRAADRSGNHVNFALIFARGGVNLSRAAALRLVPGADITDFETNDNYGIVTDACTGYSHRCRKGDPSPGIAALIGALMARLAPGGPQGP